MRVWRSVKALGCATLRDGVYLLPESDDHKGSLAEAAAQAEDAGGNGEVYRLLGKDDAQEAALRALFDRAEEYASVAKEIKSLGGRLSSLDPTDAERKLKPIVRRFEQVVSIDFFPSAAQRQTLDLLDTLREAIARRISPDEPTSLQVAIPRLSPHDHQGCVWATRARPWVDRLASAWLIRCHIDLEARFLWLVSPTDCPADAIGFDFDGATFSHAGERVTFEALLAAFGLEGDPALTRLGALVHFLDVGGLPCPEAAGIEAVLTGLRALHPDDGALLDEACRLFDSLYCNYQKIPHD